MKDNIFKSDLLKRVYNNSDCTVRFIYTQVPIVRNLIRRLIFWKIYGSDFKHIDTIYTEFKEIFNRYDLTFKDKQILELGPGNSIALALNCLCNGAKKYQMVDKYPRILKTEKQAQYVLEQINYFEKKYRRSLNDFINKDTLDFNLDILTYTQDSVEDLRTVPSESIDAVLSISVFEHVKDVDKSFQEMKRVLKTGGVMCHKIDLRDHYNFNKPFKFLKYSGFVWNIFLTKEGFSYTNRLRVDDFEYLLSKHGFEIIEQDNQIYEGELPDKKRFNGIFRDKDVEDLTVIGMTFLAKKTD